jgi:hypothetical protein
LALTKRNRIFGSLKSHNEVLRQFFSVNMEDLVSKVLRQSRIDAAKTLGVDYGWLRKACAMGVTRPNKRNNAPLEKVAAFFHIPVEALWKPFLVVQIWLDEYLPEVKRFFIERFEFDEYARTSEEFREEIATATESGCPIEYTATDDRKEALTGTALPRIEDMFEALLTTGRYEYLRNLVNDLFVAEQQKGAFLVQNRTPDVSLDTDDGR